MSVHKYYTNKAKTKFLWRYVVTVPSNDFDKFGNPIRKQLTKRGFSTKKEAEVAEREVLKNAELGNVEFNSNLTFSAVIKNFLDYSKNEGKYSKGTIQNYEGYFNHHMHELSLIPVKRLTPILIQNWHRNLYKKGASDHVYNGCIKLAKRAFNYAIELKLISQNLFIDIKPVSVAPKLRHRFSTTELKELIETCKESLPEYYCLFVLATLTGMRMGEYSAIKTSDIVKNEFGYSIRIDKQITRGELKYKTKTNSSVRIVEISKQVYDTITWHIETYGIKGDDFLFKVGEGKYMYSTWIERKFDCLLKLCGYPKHYCRVHDLRGQYVDIMHLCGIPITYISRQVGHTDPKITSQVYTQILNQLPQEANKKMDNLIFGT